MKKIASLVLLLMFCVVFAVGCQPNTEAPSEETSKTTEQAEETEISEDTILVGIAMSSADEFCTNLLAMYEEIGKEMGVKIVSTNANSNVSKQISDVESLIAQQPDVIVLRAVDSDGLIPACEAVKAAGIPLVLDEADVYTEAYDVQVAMDQVVHGRLLGEYVKEWLEEDNTCVAKIGYILGMDAPIVNGRRDGILETCSDAELISSQIADWQADKAMKVTEDWLQAFPEINVFAAMNDEMAVGAIQALTAAGVNMDDVLVLGVDGTVNGQQYIRSGELDATTYQDMSISARKVLEVAVGLVNGETYEKTVDPNMVSLMTIDTIDALVGSAQ